MSRKDEEVAKEVIKIQKRLDKIVAKNEGQHQAIDLLKALQATQITLDVLTKTRIGLTVNSLRKSSTDETVITLSKALIKHWKRLLEAKNDSKSESNGAVSTANNKPANDTKPKPQESKRPQDVRPPKPSAYAQDTTNDVRLKCREMISQALRVEIGGDADEAEYTGDVGDPDDVAAKIEECIYKEFKNTDQKYKNRVRSRVANLKDSKNPDLRCNVIRGAISPEKIAVMTAEEMASTDMKAMRQKFTKEAINDHQMSVQGGTSTDLLKCPKCKKNNCTYNQVQTRSADEPMTTFCLCNECGKRWKFC